MKKIFRVFALLAVCATTFLLTACDDTVPTITVQNAIGIRDKITIDFTIWDEEDVLTELVLTLSGKVDGEDYETTSRVSISGGEYAEEDDVTDSVEVGDFIGEVESITFSNLEASQTYSVVFTATYNDKVKKITPTIDSGKTINLSKINTLDTGTEDVPHQVSTVDDFDIIRNDPDGFFELVNDIDCEGNETKPFFSSDKKFVGEFDGKDYTIKNFKQDSYVQYAGLFGYIDEGAVVKNLNVTDVNIFSARHTNAYFGALAGYNAGTIENVDITGVVIGTNGSNTGTQYVGGFVGYAKGTSYIAGCTITNVEFDLNVPASSRVGGFVGTNEPTNKNEASIIDCEAINVYLDVQIPSSTVYNYESSDVVIVYAIGGFVGDNRGLVETCDVDAEIYVYVEGSATDVLVNEKNEDAVETTRNQYIESMDLYVGGFAGANYSGKIFSSTSDVEVNVEATYLDKIYVGGFVAYNDYLSVVSGNSFEDATFTVIVDENTHLSTDSNGLVSLIGNSIGVDNSHTNSTFTNEGAITFVAKIRVASDDDGTTVYDYVAVTLA